MAWLFLLVAGLCEIGWAIGLKYTEGFTRLLPTSGTVVAMAASIGFLGLGLKALPVGTAYAVWTGYWHRRHHGARHLSIQRARNVA